MPQVIQAILSDKTRGEGTQENCYRTVIQVHTFDGNLIAENDPCPEGRVKPSQGWYTITYRGCGRDLATDVIELLSAKERGKFLERISELTAGLDTAT